MALPKTERVSVSTGTARVEQSESDDAGGVQAAGKCRMIDEHGAAAQDYGAPGNSRKTRVGETGDFGLVTELGANR